MRVSVSSYKMILIFGIITVVLIVVIWRKKYKHWRCLNEIPLVSSSLPLVGLYKFPFYKPEKIFAVVRQNSLAYYPIFRLSVLHATRIIILSPEDIELVLSTTKHITKSNFYNFLHAWLGTGLLTSSGAKWKNRRKILTPTFHFSILQEFLQIFNQETEALVKNLSKKCQDVDVIPLVTEFTLSSISETAMGLTLDASIDVEEYKNSIYKLGHLFATRIARPWLHSDFLYNLTADGRLNKVLVKKIHQFTLKIIANRKKGFSYSSRKHLAMLDLLLKYRMEGADLDDEGIREEVDTFLFEGHDTTATCLCFTLMILANHKEQQDEIYKELSCVVDASKPPTYNELQELKYMERCIKESLRLYPSVPMISRMTDEKIRTFSGYTIPKGWSVNLSIFNLHRNPNVFPDPEKFDPDRFLPENMQNRHPFAYIPFSAGPRNCIGIMCNIDHLELIMPRYAVRGGDVILKCEHSVPPEQLYKVEWQKGGNKIFQYIKGRKPPFRFFNKNLGADLNTANSSQEQIQLTKLDFGASGSYSCVVSMDTPIFSKDSESKDLTIIEPQEDDPVISFNKQMYQIGEVLEANCTTAPARPPPHITWLINGEKVVDTLTKSFSAGFVHGHGFFEQRAPSIKQLSIEVSELHVGDDGQLRLTCLSTYPGYVNPNENYADLRKTSEIIQIVEMEGPVDEPFSHSNVSSSSYHTFLNLYSFNIFFFVFFYI